MVDHLTTDYFASGNTGIIWRMVSIIIPLQNVCEKTHEMNLIIIFCRQLWAILGHDNFCWLNLKARTLMNFDFNSLAMPATQPMSSSIAVFEIELFICQNSDCLATNKLRFDTGGLLIVGSRQRQVSRQHTRDNQCFWKKKNLLSYSLVPCYDNDIVLHIVY